MIICMETFHCTTDTIAQPLKARDYKDPLIVILDRATYNQGENAKYDFEVKIGGRCHLLLREVRELSAMRGNR